MKKLLCVLLVFACLLCFGGCGNIGGDHDVIEGPLLYVRSGEEPIKPAYARITWSETWSEADRSFISADMAGIEGMLDDLAEYPHFIESITYDGGVTFEPRADTFVGDNIDVYAIDGDAVTALHLNAAHDVLDELEPGEYYVVVSVTVEGELIEVVAGDFEFEKEGYDCLFKLTVE